MVQKILITCRFLSTIKDTVLVPYVHLDIVQVSFPMGTLLHLLQFRLVLESEGMYYNDHIIARGSRLYGAPSCLVLRDLNLVPPDRVEP